MLEAGLNHDRNIWTVEYLNEKITCIDILYDGITACQVEILVTLDGVQNGTIKSSL